MTKQQTIKADSTSAVILQIPLEMLYISDLNPRKAVSEAHIESLADSIERFGLIHNLAGLMDDDGKVGIVAGGCRLRAIQMIAERSKTHPFATVPVKLATDAAEAEDWASAENAAREDMTPADEIRAFGRMKSRGASVPEIALAFAVTEARVYQRLALAGLPEPVLDALAAGEISLGTAKAFTLSDDDTHTLSLLDQVKGQAVSESAIKNALHPDAIKATDRRVKFVGIDAYEAEGGTVTRDLFSDEAYLASPALLDRLFTEKLEAARADLIDTQGWAWAEARPEAWLNYYELDQMKLVRPLHNRRGADRGRSRGIRRTGRPRQWRGSGRRRRSTALGIAGPSRWRLFRGSESPCRLRHPRERIGQARGHSRSGPPRGQESCHRGRCLAGTANDQIRHPEISLFAETRRGHAGDPAGLGSSRPSGQTGACSGPAGLWAVGGVRQL